MAAWGPLVAKWLPDFPDGTDGCALHAWPLLCKAMFTSRTRAPGCFLSDELEDCLMLHVHGIRTITMTITITIAITNDSKVA